MSIKLLTIEETQKFDLLYEMVWEPTPLLRNNIKISGRFKYQNPTITWREMEENKLYDTIIKRAYLIKENNEYYLISKPGSVGACWVVEDNINQLFERTGSYKLAFEIFLL